MISILPLHQICPLQKNLLAVMVLRGVVRILRELETRLGEIYSMLDSTRLCNNCSVAEHVFIPDLGIASLDNVLCMSQLSVPKVLSEANWTRLKHKTNTFL